jgi:imidazolonepropionase-like amidohydrolase
MTLAITNGTIIDGSGVDPRTGMTMLVEDEHIVALGRDGQISVPREATVIDAQGGSVLPGLIDTHVHFLIEYMNILRHLQIPPSLRLLEAIPRMKATLDAGVTTVRDAGGSPAGLKMAVERGIVAGPRMQVAITLLSQTGGHGDGHFPSCVNVDMFGQFADVPRGVVDGIDEMRKTVREILRAGADWIKIATTGGVLSIADAPTASQFTIDEIAVAVYEASAHGKRCMAHAQGSQGIKHALEAGVASIEHGFYLTDELIEMMIAKDVYLVPTLVAAIDVVDYGRQNPHLLPPVMLNKALSVVEDHRQSFRRAVAAGVKVAMGTDSGVGRHGGNGRELSLMVANGMTPMQSIVASTSSAARLLHLDQSLGTLETGKLADIIIVSGDVLADINRVADPANVQLVLKGGQMMKNTLSAAVSETT